MRRKKTYLLFLFFMLYFISVFSQIVLPPQPIIDEKSLEINIIDSEFNTDSTFVLEINSNVLDSIIKDKISYLKNFFKGCFKNIQISFQSNNQFNYLRITGNIPNSFIENNKSLIGIIKIDDFQLFVYNHSDIPIDNYFHKTKLKIFIPKYDYSNMIINTPTWFYVIINETKMYSIMNETEMNFSLVPIFNRRVNKKPNLNK